MNTYPTRKHKARKTRSRLVLSKMVVDAIEESIGKHPPERGGILGSDPDGVVRHFVADTTAQCSAVTYNPDINAMNQQIKNWKTEDIQFCGFAHSHPGDYNRLSSADEEYAKRILASFKGLDFLALPLVISNPNVAGSRILPFIAVRDPDRRDCISFRLAKLEVEGTTHAVQSAPSHGASRRVGGAQPHAALIKGSPSWTDQPEIERPVELRYYGRFPSWWRLTAATLSGQQGLKEAMAEPSLQDRLDEVLAAQLDRHTAERYFERVQSACDLARLDQTRLVVIGTGGSVGMVRDCARIGFGEFVVIDGDTISDSNVGTQGVNPNKIGVPKVDGLAEEILDINPSAAIVAVHGKIEGICDDDFELLCTGPLRGALKGKISRRSLALSSLNYASQPKQVILLALTDNFEAQARGHRLGLQFGLPTLCSQEYQEGRGAEITYTVPGVTPACHRCITSSRYRAYLQNGYRNNVTSHGASIYGAELRNAALGHMLLAVAHHETDHARYGKLITRLANRNLMLIRMDPDFDTFFGRPVFSRRLAGASEPDAFFMMDALFLKQTPDSGQSKNRPVCPDCGGMGDLRRCIGTFEDTRMIRVG